MRQYRTRRNLLHKDKLDEFVAWAVENGYRTHPRPLKADFEVARLEKVDPAGNHRHIVIYARNGGDHLTVDGAGLSLVQRWLRSRVKVVEHV